MHKRAHKRARMQTHDCTNLDAVTHNLALVRLPQCARVSHSTAALRFPSLQAAPARRRAHAPPRALRRRST
eukprot:1006124-Pleurochrysis_carterae.AAC.2